MRKLLRVAKRIANVVLGTASDSWFWKYRHIFDKRWAEKYISENSLSHPHRKLLVEKILKHKPQSILEIGCASGPNLILLAQKLPQSKLTGLDISRSAVQAGRKYLELQNIKNVKLETGNILDLKKFADKSFDIVFTDATLIYVGPDNIKKVIREMARICRTTLVLNEWHSILEKSFPHRFQWVHNYQSLFKEIVPSEEIKLTKISEDVWPGNWAKYGYIIEIKI